jgi:regulatory protein
MPAGTITALCAQATDPQRVNVFVNGEFAIGVSLTTVVRAGLHVGKVVSEAEYAQLEQAEQVDRAVHAALRSLEARPRSSDEIRERLRRKAFAPAVIEAAIERLSELSLIDDAAFARFWVENRQASRPRGVAALRAELQRKGIDRAVADAVLRDQRLVGDETVQALALARAALRKYASLPDRATFERRMAGYLQRRGFSFETIRPIVAQLWAEVKGTAEDTED